jgi:energy-coupling factor transporter ATP-binding protein EcfA2
MTDLDEEAGMGNTKYKEVPNKIEGGSDYFSVETGAWVTWGEGGLMDEEIDQALKDNPPEGNEGETIMRRTPPDRADVDMIEDRGNYPVCPSCKAVSSLLYELDPEDGHVTKWYCDACGYSTENLKDFRPAKGEEMLEQGDESYGSGASQGQGWEGQGGGTENQQLNPTTEQNISPFTQSQFVPTGSQIRYPTPKKEAQYDMSYSVTEGDNAGEIEQTSETYNTQDYWKPVETPQWAGMQPAGKGEEDTCPNCGSNSLRDEYNDYSVAESCSVCGFRRVFGPSGWKTTNEGSSMMKKEYEMSDVTCPSCSSLNIGLNKEGTELVCNDCGNKLPVEKGEEELYSAGDIDEDAEAEYVPYCGYGCCPRECNCEDCEACSVGIPKEELRDPRVDPDEKGKEKEKQLSPEAQKIAGTDKASVKAKESKKPKLEVNVSDKVSILGKTGSGKTNLIKVLMSDILKDYDFVLLDSIGNFAEYEGKENVEYHQVTPSDTNTVDDIIYKALERGNCMVVIDEVDRYQTKKGTMLNELVNLGRNYEVGGIFAARRTADVDKDILSNSPFIFVFQHILPQDLDVLIDWFAQPEATFRVLQEYEAILFKNGEEVWKGKVPEKPTTTPKGRPNLPKKPKGSEKEKGKEKPTGDKEKEPEAAGGKPTEPDEEKEKGAPELPTPPGEIPEEEPEPTHEFESQKEEGAFVCQYDNKAFKYEKDFINHVNSHVTSV